MSPDQFIPMEWPAEWAEPGRLELVRQTPVNCLLCAADPPPALRDAAKAAGLECLSPSNPIVTWRPLKEIDWKSSAPIVGVSDGVWPKLDLRRGSTTESTGPTGAPWLDANGWIVQLARSRGAGKTVWLRADPPQPNEVLSLSDYLLALHEAAAFGARRPVWLSPVHVQELERGLPAATQAWQTISAALAWWKQHQQWRDWPVEASFLVVSDFSGANEYMATEVLNLSARRDLAFRTAAPDQVTPAALARIRAVLWVDQQLPKPQLLEQLRQFAAAGGLLLVPKETAAKLAGLQLLDDSHPRFNIHTAGKGRVAVPKTEFEDPYLVALDTHLFLSRRYDSIRLFNGGSINVHHVSAPGRARSVVHLLNYARRVSAQDVLLQSQRPVRAARLLDPSKPAPLALTINRAMDRYEMPLPPLAVYAAVELEHSS